MLTGFESFLTNLYRSTPVLSSYKLDEVQTKTFYSNTQLMNAIDSACLIDNEDEMDSLPCKLIDSIILTPEKNGMKVKINLCN